MLTKAELRVRAVVLGEVIAARRKKFGLSQEELGERVGCDRQTICRLENAAYSTLVRRIECVAIALGWTAGELFTARDVLLAERSGGRPLKRPRKRPGKRPGTPSGAAERP